MSRLASPGGTVLGVVFLACVIAITSHASTWAPVRTGFPDRLLLLVIVAGCFGASLSGIWLISRGTRSAGGDAFRRSLPVAIVVAVLASLFAFSQAPLYGPAAAGSGVERDEGSLGQRLLSDWVGPATRGEGETADGMRVGAPTLDAGWMFRALMLAVIAFGAAVLLVARGPRRRGAAGSVDDPSDDERRIEAHGAIVGAIDAMLADPDPRTAIIGAYARLLEELETIGASRRTYEGPSEHLRRVLGALAVRQEPLETVVRLFTVARFSEHALTIRDRDSALTALREVAGDLSVPSVRLGRRSSAVPT